ncbi:MAG: HD-GYP domain-containing protein [Solirubrobacteraceae bacterium]
MVLLLLVYACWQVFHLIGMRRRSRHESLHDVLTGLPNRRCLVDDLNAALASAARRSQWTLAMFDLDGFKSYNDTFGRLAGDHLLARLGRRLGESVGSQGRAYRLGGDEFCVLAALDGPPEELLARAAEALSEQGAGFSIASSVGTVSIPREAEEVSAGLHLAGTRMYASRHGNATRTLVAQMRDVLLSAAAEHTRDLGEHMLEVGQLSRNVACRLELDAETVELTLRTGEFHDVGKLAVPETVLRKPESLADAEWGFVCNHTVTRQTILGAAPALRTVARLVRSTHERFDGTGYPDGLKGQEIPLPSRIVFACDAFHAMISDRPYAPGVTESQARDELLRGAGTQFDPRVIKALLAELAHRRPQRASSASAAPTSRSSRGEPRT